MSVTTIRDLRVEIAGESPTNRKLIITITGGLYGIATDVTERELRDLGHWLANEADRREREEREAREARMDAELAKRGIRHLV